MILVEHWPSCSFVTAFINDRWFKPDLAFQRYSVGKSKPNYPLPAIPRTVQIASDYVVIGGHRYNDVSIYWKD